MLSVDFISGQAYTSAKGCLAEMGMNYQFDTDKISQHVVKYGVDMRPPLLPEQDRTKLQDYGNWLVEQFPEVFETMLVGPREVRVQRTFLLPNAKRIELATFVLTHRGPVFTFPERLYIDRPHELAIPEKDKIFRKAFDELRTRFPDRAVPRVGVVHEFVFDTEYLDSLEVVTSCLKHDLWREKTKNLRILLEAPTDDKNVNIELRPTHLQRTGLYDSSAPQEMKFGIIVNVDINNRQITGDLTKAEITDILAFAGDYVPDELIKFLNNEQ
ncbi:MAG: hypothetical protein KBI32_01120 [Phycisphaerae bacterium]|nr:hypothetical protein [Phycisphaerae bacterium]HON90895.1 hypothetical protein [Sedimentisphaerales bacterium]